MHNALMRKAGDWDEDAHPRGEGGRFGSGGGSGGETRQPEGKPSGGDAAADDGSPGRPPPGDSLHDMSDFNPQQDLYGVAGPRLNETFEDRESYVRSVTPQLRDQVAQLRVRADQLATGDKPTTEVELDAITIRAALVSREATLTRYETMLTELDRGQTHTIRGVVGPYIHPSKETDRAWVRSVLPDLQKQVTNLRVLESSARRSAFLYQAAGRNTSAVERTARLAGASARALGATLERYKKIAGSAD